MQPVNLCIEDFLRMSRSDFMAKYDAPMLVFAPTESGSGGDRMEATSGFDFRATQLLRLVAGDGHGPQEPVIMGAQVAPLKKRPGAMGRQVSVGRTAATDICLTAQDVSTMHAYFGLGAKDGPPAYTITDSASTNGTRMGGVQLPPNIARPIRNATRVAFASHEAVFYSPEGFYHWVQSCAAEVRASSRLG